MNTYGSSKRPKSGTTGKLGKELDLFSFHTEGAGVSLLAWKRHGAL